MIMRNVRIIKLLLFWLVLFIEYNPAFASDEPSALPWMQTPLNSMASSLGCLEVPQFTNFHEGSADLDLAQSGTWVSTGVKVEEGKTLKITLNSNNVEEKPRKYLVMYRIDPRFAKPQIFIKSYDYVKEKYVSDFHTFKNGQLVKYQDNPVMVFPSRIKDYTDYFNFAGRAGISVNKDDVVNITLVDSGAFFSAAGSDFIADYDYPTPEIAVAYTKTPIMDNRLIYSLAGLWCDAITTSSVQSSANCNNDVYISGSNSLSLLFGNLNEPKFSDIKASLQRCPEGANGSNNEPLCFYDKGRGMKISIGGQAVKTEQSSFMHSDFLNKDFIYYKSTASGFLDFGTSWAIDGMFPNFNQFMKDWSSFNAIEQFMNYVTNINTDLSVQFLHFGRYIMMVELGNGNNNIDVATQSNIKVEYFIAPDGTGPGNNTVGTSIQNTTKVNAPVSGNLWIRVLNTDNKLQGTVKAEYGYYTGGTWFSGVLYGKVISPLRESFNGLTKQFYTKLTTNAVLQRIAKTALTLYVLLYGLFYLAGVTRISTQDLITRIVKITIIVTLFSQASWNFFNNNFFIIFTEGIDSLMSRVVGETSSVNNVFGFIDPIIDKYTNPRIWGLLFIQLLQIHNGLTFFAIMIIYGMLLYFRALIEVVVTYCLAFVAISVLVSLAPFFITFMLFERTKSIFTNWISTLFNYLIQPTILLIFLLLIDQLMSEQLLKGMVKACWGEFIPIEIGLDLKHMGIPIDFAFKLPFLPYIPFYVPFVPEVNNVNDVLNGSSSWVMIATSSLLFYAYCVMGHGLVSYMTSVTALLTNVMPADQAGNRGAPSNPVQAIISQLGSVTKPVANAIKSPFATFKRKIIDQGFRAHGGGGRGQADKNYVNKIVSGPRKDVDDSSSNSK